MVAGNRGLTAVVVVVVLVVAVVEVLVEGEEDGAVPDKDARFPPHIYNTFI